MKILIFIVCIGALSFLSRDSQAQADLMRTQPRVESLQPRIQMLGHEFSLGVGVMPLNAFYIGLVPNAAYTYHISPRWAWEVANVHFSLNFDTSLADTLLTEHGVQPKDGGDEHIKLFASSSAVFKPFYGKVSHLNHTVIFTEAYASLGLGPFMSNNGLGDKSFIDPAIVLGAGFRLFFNQAVSLRLDIQDFLVVKNMVGFINTQDRGSGHVENVLLFSLSASLNIKPSP
jgi:outer membrane beta-barrel protein